MRHSFGVLLGQGLALSAAGCSDYLSGPGVSSTQDPNNILKLTQPGPLYIGVEQAGPPQREGQVARYAVEYVQQIAGAARQAIGFDLYQAAPSDVDTYFEAVYGSSNLLTGGGGLLDVKKMEQLARKKSDSIYVGIAKIYQALIVGYAADIWGDIPYRQAADSTIPKPAFDPQLQIYGDLQQQLDSAINFFLKADVNGITNLGPATDGSELIYKGRSSTQLEAVYTAVAHSLKARYFLHVQDYANALAQANLGISTPDDDFLWFHDASAAGQNVWWQYNATRGDYVAGAAVIDLMKRRFAAGVEDILRLQFYFYTADFPKGNPADTGAYFGARPALATVTTAPGGDNGTGSAKGNFSFFNTFIDGATPPGDFRQPELTFAETQLIAAEAAWRLNGGGADPTVLVAAAQPFLDAARKNRHYGATGGAPVTFGDAPGALPATLQHIIEEKYITLFLNPEVWNDYKRTCLPSLAPAPALGSSTPGTASPGSIPGRLPYGLSEINANPNTPGGQGPATNSAGIHVTSTSQNPNAPTPCPALNYVNSVPLAN